MTARIYRFQCSWVPLSTYENVAIWMNGAHVASIPRSRSKRFARFKMESGNMVHLFRVTKQRGILWSWLGLERSADE